ncbi:murein L,D-transpeptidase [Flavobacterium sp. K5-23]|uniref:L,D-transpeptidase family protein n=1 Tax=Flavobacterium sp. K5-23 TaxID=2746225 RepID=UPI00200DD6C3|nr:L,D-transpeptidase family protein [Flavobacterium sp. K5-23]UQD55798.1 L,D-transpeptidase family protein [Flavobacterium sp. K5-23]
MKNLALSIIALLITFSSAAINRNGTENTTVLESPCVKTYLNTTINNSIVTIDLATIDRFFKKYTSLKKYRSDVVVLYKNRDYKSIWYDDKELIEFASLLYSKVNQLENEGLKFNIAYKDKIAAIFNNGTAIEITKTEKELLLSSLYIFYAKKVFQGLDVNKVQEIGWFLPQKTTSYKILLDSLLAAPQLLHKNESQLHPQYYKLRDALIKYRQIEKRNDWNPIETDLSIIEYNPGDSSKTIGQIRHRLVVLEDLEKDSKSNIYDAELMEAVLKFKKRNGYKPNYMIGSQHINRMNIPIEQYIKTIIINMERCRWISPGLAKEKELIMVNIPALKLIYRKNGNNVLESKVFVGINMLETVIFSSSISRVVFSPYWNVPRSIVENEIKPAIAKDSSYLTKNNMEWYKNGLRQKPGPRNSMGLVKFLFPNTYDIYLHDTPYKESFDADFPEFSHGCINMQKAKELAYLILEDYPDWPVDKIDQAMDGSKETTCVLKNKIPIHIGYFTAWVPDSGEINFYFDIYHKDYRLAELLFNEETH